MVLQTKKQHVMKLQKYDIRKPNSEEFEERWWAPSNTPILDNSGQVQYICHRTEDVTEFVQQNMSNMELKSKTERLAMEIVLRSQEREKMLQIHDTLKQQVEASNERYKLLTSIAPVGIFNTDECRNLCYVNAQAAQIIGVSEQDLVNHDILEHVHEGDRDMVLNELFQCSSPKNVKFRFVSNTKETWVMGNCAIENCTDGTIKSFIGTITDIDEFVNMEKCKMDAMQHAKEEQMKRAQDAVSHKEDLTRFVDVVCHEIRNPLNGILGCLAMIQKYMENIGQCTKNLVPCQGADIQNVQQLIKDIQECANYQQVITNNVLNYSKLEANKVVIQEEPFSVNEVVQSVQSMVESKILEKHLHVTVCLLKDDESHFVGDSNLLKQVVMNLVSNAVKYTPSNGSISIQVVIDSVDECTRMVQIKVSDTGIGMSIIEQQHLFEKYVNINYHTSYREGGSGLGLCITKSLVQLLQGSIHVQSSPKQGSIFTVSIPFKVHNKIKLQQHINTSPLPSSDQLFGKHVLIVEDNNINRKVLQYLLQQKGYKTSCAANGAEAVEMISLDQYAYDLIFMDLEMPCLGGLDATIAIRKLGYKAPIVCLSGNTRTEHLQRVLAAGMNDMISKPFLPEQINNVLAMFL